MHAVLLIDKDKTKELNNNIDFIPCDCNDCKHYKVAIKASATKSKDSITKNWEALNLGKCHFRIRLEIDKNGNTILGFEADLPSETAL